MHRKDDNTPFYLRENENETTNCVNLMWISDIKHDGKAQGSVSQKSPETFCKCEAIFSSSVYKNGEVRTPKASSMKRTCVCIKNMRITAL